MPYLTPHQDLAEFCSCGRPIGLVVDSNGDAWRACAFLWDEIAATMPLRADSGPGDNEDEFDLGGEG